MFKIEDIKDPSFLKDLTIPQLEELSGDIRKFLIEKISETGGHLSSNLGIVELTIALHKVFESPKDKFIFDVSHQSYVHKILTGRGNRFNTLRQYKGLSGFSKMSESAHDAFETGHSSTSISAQSGFEVAKEFNKEIGRTISIIGDGSINSGLAFEGLNYLGQFQNNNPIIILNDNEMSITKNVGSFSRVFDRLRGSSKVTTARRGISKLTPNIFSGIKDAIKSSIKTIAKKSNIFEDLGYLYIGPINGHDYKRLLKALEFAKKRNRPVVIHVTTQKGRGYQYAEVDLIGKWHGIAPYNVETGLELKPKKEGYVSWSKVVSSTLEEIARVDEKLYVISSAMITGSALNDFGDMYPDRLLDVGIAESHSAVLASSLALNGANVFLSFYSTFAQRAYDQFLHDIARQKQKVVIGLDRAGLVGGDGDTHQGIYDIPMMYHIPNTVITAPKDANEAYNLVHTGFYNNELPFVIRFPRGVTKFNKQTDFVKKDIKFGSWEILREGTDISIISFGNSLELIEQAVIDGGLNATIVNARFIKPIDTNMIDQLVAMNKPILVYEESIVTGGLYSQVLQYLNENHKNYRIYSMGINEKFVEHGSYNQLLEELGLDKQSVINKYKEIINN